MRIEFDPTNRDEATAVRAVLTAIHGPEWTGKTFKLALPHDVDPDEPTGVLANPPEDFALSVENAPETDSTGTPWDARIHATPATTNKDGTWRAKRGVTAEQVAAVRAEREAPLCEDPDDLKHVMVDTIKEGDAPKPALELAMEQGASVAEYVEGPDSAPQNNPAPSAPPAPPLAPTGQSAAPLAPAPIEQPPADTVPTTQSSPVAPSDTGYSFLDVMKAVTATQKQYVADRDDKEAAQKEYTAKVKELCAAVGAGDGTMGLNGPDKGDLRVAFMALLTSETGE